MTTPSALCHVFYISRSLATPVEVERIVAAAREINAQRDVTGALLYTGGHFAQVLEGPPAALDQTMNTILADCRHERVTRLLDGRAARRRFRDWTMAFVEAPGADDLLQHLLEAPAVPADRAERVMRLMVDACAAQPALRPMGAARGQAA